MTYDFRLTTAAGRTLHVGVPADVFRDRDFELLWEPHMGEAVVRVGISFVRGEVGATRAADR